MTRMNSTAFAVSSVCVLLAVSIGSARQQDHELSGIRGIPVEGHDNIAAIHIVGTKEVLLSGAAGRKLHERLVAVSGLVERRGCFTYQAAAGNRCSRVRHRT